jgi:hypothetical protein
MSILKTLKKKDHLEVIHYVVLIEAPLNVVGDQLGVWFDNTWRPSASALVFKCSEAAAAVKIGSKCTAEFKKILKVKWQLEVTGFTPNHSVESALSGFFTGTETVTIEERDNGIKVDYHMTYELQNPIYQIIWSLWMEDVFVDEVRKKMEALKAFCQKAK